MSDRAPAGIKGWLLLLCLLLILWQPISLALVASSAVSALSVRGWPLGLVLLARIIVASFSVAAGIALLGQRSAAIGMTKLSLALSAATDVFVYSTPYFPSNRMPGDTPFYIAGSLIYYSAWAIYLFRSKRVRNTFG